MHRKQWSHGQGRRSSAPKRLSVVVPDTEERNNKNVCDGKKSFIPRPTTSRSSSVERDGVQSSKGARCPRSTSMERLNVDENRRVSDYRSRSSENVVTPKNTAVKTSAVRNTGTVSRTVRKDTRPLTDRAFQNVELVKVEEYLLAKQIISPGQNICSSMTLKLFVHIMNSLLSEFFPRHALTLSNYCEVIPLLMRKLKYPGNLTRSWLVTANSSHTWPNVLGLLSWLVYLINIQASDVKFVVDDDGDNGSVLDHDKVKKLVDFSSQRYIEWTESDDDNASFIVEDDQQFFDDLFLSATKPLKDYLKELEKDVQDLEELKRQNENTEEYCADQKFKIFKTELEKKKSTRNNLKEKCKKMQIAVEKFKKERHTLVIENDELKQCIGKYNCVSFNEDDVAKFQSDVMSLQNVIKLQDTHITDINNQCYSSDLVSARLQGKLDEIRLQRDANLRKCTSQYINAKELQLSLNYGNESNSKVLAEFLAHVNKTKLSLESILKECIEEEKSNKAKIFEVEEKIKLLDADIFNRQANLKQCELKLAEMQNTSSSLESQMGSKKEEYSKLKEKQISLEHNLQLENHKHTELQEELKVLCNSFLEQKAKYLRTLKRMGEELQKYFINCRDLLNKHLND